MANERRKCRFAEAEYRGIDLRRYEQLIIDAVNKTVANKNPKVYEDYFSTDPLTHSEAVLLGRELAKIPQLKDYGKEVTIFRLFDGKIYECESSKTPVIKRKGGRMK